MRRKTTKRRRHSQQNVLQVRVMSPRIAWFGFLKFAAKLAKFACLLAVIFGLGYGIWRGIQHAFYRNSDFRLQVLDLNSNPVIDELGVAQIGGIDLTRNPNLFEIDVQNVTTKLKALPAISDAHVERHLPGTLVVRVSARTPVAWISSNGLITGRKEGAMLVDDQGIAYPCPALQAEAARTLPIIELPARDEQPITAGEKILQPELEHCVMLLDSARAADPSAIYWIESIRTINDWSLELATKQGVTATFGLGDHERQIANFRAALDHAAERGYALNTINLMPKFNIPITLRGDAPPPKETAAPSSESSSGKTGRRARDLDNLLHRN